MQSLDMSDEEGEEAKESEKKVEMLEAKAKELAKEVEESEMRTKEVEEKAEEVNNKMEEKPVV